MSNANDQNQIVPTARQALSKRSFGLVRRGLDQLSRPTKTKGRVLLVDDEPVILEYTEKILLANGYDVRCTTKPLEAIDLAKHFQPDVALLGFIMPFMDGLRLGRELSGFLLKTKIVLWIESYVLDPEHLEAFQREGYDFALLPAPFEREDLLKKVDSWVRGATKIDSVTGFGLAEWFSFEVCLEIVLHEGENPLEVFSMVFLEIVERWSESSPPTQQVRRKLFGELAYGIKQNCLQHLRHQLFDCFRHDDNRLAVLLNRESRGCAEELAAKLHRYVQNTEWGRLVGRSVEISAKFATVSFPEDGRTETELINKGISRLSRGASAHQWRKE